MPPGSSSCSNGRAGPWPAALPRGAHPRRGAILLLAQVSSMKTKPLRGDAILILLSTGRQPRHVGASRSPATTLFFEAEFLGMDAVPHRAVVDLQAAPGEVATSPRKVKSPSLIRCITRPVRPRNRLRLLTTHLPGATLPVCAQPLHPVNRGADRDPKLFRGPVTRHARLNRRNNPLPKINRIRFAHPCRPPIPASMVNQKSAYLGIPNRFKLNSSRFSGPETLLPTGPRSRCTFNYPPLASSNILPSYAGLRI